MKIVVCTGGFDPLHSGHICYLKAARALGDMLIVGLNSDQWLERKKGRAFMPFNERRAVLEELSCVDYVINFSDDDNTACDAIIKVRTEYPEATIVFANGGDRTQDNIPEMSLLTGTKLEFVFGVGGEDKANSSSWILEEWKAPKTERPWGYYRVIHEYPGVKVKELTLKPGCAISYQKHDYRSEYWMVIEGAGSVILANPEETDIAEYNLNRHEGFIVPEGYWHKLTNIGLSPLQLVEIQFGTICDEDDITRKLLDKG